MATSKERRPLIAGLLSLALPGLGQLYNGHLARAAVFWALGLVSWSAWYLTPLLSTPAGLWSGCGLSGLLSLAAILEAVSSARRLGVVELRRFQRPPVYAGAFVGVWFVSVLGSQAADLAVGRYASYRMPAGSMAPSIEVGEVIWTGPAGLGRSGLGRGEVIAFAYPVDVTTSFIKRIVGVAGDVLELREGALYVNDEAVERCHLGAYALVEPDPLTGELLEAQAELYLEHLDGRTYRVLQTGPGEDWGPERVPPGQVYVLGDNRDNSHDSRRWGGVALDRVHGRALFQLYLRSPTTGLSLEGMGRAIDALETLDPVQRQRLEQCRRERAFGSLRSLRSRRARSLASG